MSFLLLMVDKSRTYQLIQQSNCGLVGFINNTIANLAIF